MSRLYLVRRSLETYLGPMTVQELVTCYRRLEFGLQDEVCGSCGPWIALENVKKLKRYYPDVAKVVEADILGGWGVSVQSDSTPLILGSSKRRRSHPAAIPMALLSVVFCAGLFFSFFVIKGGRLSGKFGPDSSDAAALLAQGSTADFQEHMRQLLPSLLGKASTSRKAYTEWVPYLRAYAFLKDGIGAGAIDGFDQRLLRGSEPYSAPNDCSLAFWQSVWQNKDYANRLDDVLAGRTISVTAGTQVLLWDPAWIKRRQRTPGWIYPQSYYEGCLLMAAKAADAIPNASLAKDVKARLNFILSRIGKAADTAQPTTPVLSLITCFDHAGNNASTCVVPNTFSPEWKSYFQFIRNREDISNLAKTAVAKDPVTQFNYQAEIDFYNAAAGNNGSVKDAAKKVQDEYPDVQLTE